MADTAGYLQVKIVPAKRMKCVNIDCNEEGLDSRQVYALIGQANKTHSPMEINVFMCEKCYCAYGNAESARKPSYFGEDTDYATT